MVKKLFTLEQILNKLREAEGLLGQGATPSEADRETGVTGQTYYRLRRKCGGMWLEHAKDGARLRPFPGLPRSIYLI